MHPNKSLPASIINPCQLLYSQVSNSDTDLPSLLNRVQIHKCSEAYCLKRRRGENTAPVCRFNFPHALVERSFLEKDQKERFVFQCRRNDESLNRYNAFIISNWRANIDVQAVTSKHAAIEYVAKYAAKSEPRSNHYIELLTNIVHSEMSENDNARRAVQKLMIRTISERDISSQECF